MHRNLLLCLYLFLAPLGAAMAEENGTAAKENGTVTEDNGIAAKENGSAAKELSGMSIVGNDEAPKALYIVPWKSSKIGAETSLDSMLTESPEPVDRDVFMRQLDFFEVSTADTRRER